MVTPRQGLDVRLGDGVGIGRFYDRYGDGVAQRLHLGRDGILIRRLFCFGVEHGLGPRPSSRRARSGRFGSFRIGASLKHANLGDRVGADRLTGGRDDLYLGDLGDRPVALSVSFAGIVGVSRNLRLFSALFFGELWGFGSLPSWRRVLLGCRRLGDWWPRAASSAARLARIRAKSSSTLRRLALVPPLTGTSSPRSWPPSGAPTSTVSIVSTVSTTAPAPSSSTRPAAASSASSSLSSSWPGLALQSLTGLFCGDARLVLGRNKPLAQRVDRGRDGIDDAQERVLPGAKLLELDTQMRDVSP